MILMAESYTDEELREIAERVLKGEQVQVSGLSAHEKRKIKDYYLSMRFKSYNENVSKSR